MCAITVPDLTFGRLRFVQLDTIKVFGGFVVQDLKKLQMYDKEKCKTREEREVRTLLNPFAPFHSKAAHEALVSGIVEEAALRAQIAKLQEYVDAGLRTRKEAQEYEAKKRRRVVE